MTLKSMKNIRNVIKCPKKRVNMVKKECCRSKMDGKWAGNGQ
jgi:hypothetical protein